MSSASDVLRTARVSARLTQAALAERAGVTQSVISAYEAGRREPALSTLERLVEATGSRLELTVRTQPHSRRTLQGPVGRRVRRRRERLLRAAAQHGVTVRGIFGSVARSEETADSDVDVLVDLPPGAGFFTLFRVQDAFESALGTPVDVVPAEGLKPQVLARAEHDLVPL